MHNVLRFAFCTLLFTLGICNNLICQIPISAARSAAPGSEVTIEGVALNGAELGKIRFVQDATAGIACFPDNSSAAGFENAVTTGARVRVTGILKDFSGLLEISPISAYEVLATGQSLPDPDEWAQGTNLENLEGQLVNVTCVTLENGGGSFSGGADFEVYTPSGEVLLGFIRSGHPLVGASIPAGAVDLTGIISQYQSDYELLPRSNADFSPPSCFFITKAPEQSEIQTGGFRLDWQTNYTSTRAVRYGTAPDALNALATTSGTGVDHAVDISGLASGSLYYAQVFSIHSGDTAFSEVRPYCTRSQSGGAIKVYFTRTVNQSIAPDVAPDGQSPQAVLNGLLERINQAEESIDIALYNNNRTDLTDALIDAHNRGVQVRYVGAIDADNNALTPPPPFPVLLGNDNNLMHNKFLVIDREITAKAWVVSGSLNWSYGGVGEDYNNVIMLQDQSLARAYTLEFEEMWGSTGSQPDATKAHFGSQKADNTPHKFIIGDAPVEAWFSPSDGVTEKISGALETADDYLGFAMYVFTSNDLGDAVIAAHQGGVTCRGIIDDISDSGSEYFKFTSAGVPVVADQQSAIVHHKYAVVDPLNVLADPLVVTGSHNWTFSAETYNDENTLIIRDERVAKLYLQEFAQRYGEIATAVNAPTNVPLRVFPNPAFDKLQVVFGGMEEQSAACRIFNNTGMLAGVRQTGRNGRLEIGDLPSGFYWLQIIGDAVATTVPFQKI